LYRIAFILITALAVAMGLLVGSLNSEITSLDLLWVQLQWPLGLILLCAAALGLLLGLVLVWLFSVLPLRAQLRKVTRRDGGIDSAGSLKRIDD
jgi:uncharacterized integral membrane protein